MNAPTLRYRGYEVYIEKAQTGSEVIAPLSNFEIVRGRPIAMGFAMPEQVVDCVKAFIDADFETEILQRIRLIGKSEGQSFSR